MSLLVLRNFKQIFDGIEALFGKSRGFKSYYGRHEESERIFKSKCPKIMQKSLELYRLWNFTENEIGLKKALPSSSVWWYPLKYDYIAYV